MSKGFAFVHNKFVPMNRAALSITDLTVQRGYGINEVFRTYNRRPFLLDEHMRRLRRSIRLTGMKNTPSETKIRKIVAAGLRKTRGDSLIKIIITGGPANHITPLGRPDLLIYFSPLHAHPKSHYERGFRMMTTKMRRTLPAAKSTDYYSAVLAQIEARKRGFDEAIFVSGNKLLEGTTFNIGVIKGNILTVPKKDVLEGVSMSGALRVAPKVGLRVRRAEVTFSDVRRADEVFSTSTIREILPIVRVDRIKIGRGKPGPYTKKLLAAFREYVNQATK